MTKAPIALCYCRVSTAGQVEHGASLDAQEATLRAEAERRGLEALVVRDEGMSGKNLRRPGLQRALQMLDKAQAALLLAVRIDRVSRSVADFATLLERSQRKGWSIAFTSSPVDTSTAPGRFSAHVLIAAAELERGLISDRTREALAQRKAEGVILGRVVPDSMHGTYRRVLALHDAGQSLAGIARTLNDEQVPTSRGGTWHPSTVRRIVTSETGRRMRLAA